MARQWLIPGGPFVNEDGTKEYLLPGYGFFGEDQAASAPQTLSPSGIASAEAFGTAVLSVGAVTLTPTGIGSGEAFGTASVSTPSGTYGGAEYGAPPPEIYLSLWQ